MVFQGAWETSPGNKVGGMIPKGHDSKRCVEIESPTYGAHHSVVCLESFKEGNQGSSINVCYFRMAEFPNQ